MAYLLLLLTFLLALAPRQLDLRLAAGEWNGVLAELRADLAAAVAAKESESEGLARVQIAQALVERSSYHELDEKSAADASLEALSICENRAPAALGRALLVRGRFLYSRAFDNGDWAAPKTLIRQALVRFEERRDVRGQSESWFYLGLIEQMQERLDKADEFFRKGLGQAQGLDAPLLESYFHRHLGYSAQSRKQYDRIHSLCPHCPGGVFRRDRPCPGRNSRAVCGGRARGGKKRQPSGRLPGLPGSGAAARRCAAAARPCHKSPGCGQGIRGSRRRQGGRGVPGFLAQVLSDVA
jgi:hypothetical protein